MGVNKLALPYEGQSLLMHVVSRLAACPFHQIVVVLGPKSAALRSSCEPFALVLELGLQTADMKATIRAAKEFLSAEPPSAILLALPDQPDIDPLMVSRLLALHAEEPKWILIPTHGGLRGHPVLLPWAIFTQMDQLEESEGMNTLIRKNDDCVREIEFDAAWLLADIDTPRDYSQLLERSQASHSS